MSHAQKNNIFIIIGSVLIAFSLIFILLAFSLNSVRNNDVDSENTETADTHYNADERLGVVKRISDPSTLRTTGYDIRGVIVDAVTEENIFTLDIGEEGQNQIKISLGNDGSQLGYLDKRTSNSRREGDIETNHYITNTAENIANELEEGLVVLVHVPIWIETPGQLECDAACMQRVDDIRDRGTEYEVTLEGMIADLELQTDTVFVVDMLEIEK